VPSAAAAAVHAEHNPEYTRASVHDGSSAALKLRFAPFANELSVEYVSYTNTLQEVRSTAFTVEAMQAVIGIGKMLPTDKDKSSTCMVPFTP
jgi:hypothetical protein